MVKAILDGTKTQTRRLVKPQPIVLDNQVIFEPAKGDFWVGVYNGNFSGHSSTRFKCPHGQIGDVLWVRETWRPTTFSMPTGAPYDYRATAKEDGVPLDEKWKPSIFMPRAASRLNLKIKDVRVERLNDISESDAISEGIECLMNHKTQGNLYRKYSDNGKALKITTQADNAVDSYKSLWEKINGKNSWVLNPFVWVIDFGASF